MVSLLICDNDTLIWCVQVTEFKSINKWKSYMYHVNMLGLYSVCSGYDKNTVIILKTENRSSFQD